MHSTAVPRGRRDDRPVHRRSASCCASSSARSLNVTALGDDLAKSMGGNVVRTQALSLVAVTLLAGAATAGAGPIGFVGLMVPHAVRRFTGPDWRWILGLRRRRARPALLLAADIVGRVDHPARRTAGRHRHGVPRCAGADLADPQARGGPHVTAAGSSADASASCGSAGVRPRVLARNQSWCCRCWRRRCNRASWRSVSASITVAPGDVIGVLTGSNTSFDRVVVLEWRMPRMLMALLIGAALGVVRGDLPGAHPQSARQPRHHRDQLRRLHRARWSSSPRSAAATTRSPRARWSVDWSPPSWSTRCPTATDWPATG